MVKQKDADEFWCNITEGTKKPRQTAIICCPIYEIVKNVQNNSKSQPKISQSDVRCVCSIILENHPFTEVWIYRAKLGIDRAGYLILLQGGIAKGSLESSGLQS